MACRSFLVTLLLFVFAVRSQKPPAVYTPLGWISGFYMRTREGRSISAFTSIPYASPPVGQLRFKAPVPISPWKHVWNATIAPPSCVQRNPYIRQKDIVGQEDCLYLNIYTPYLFGSEQNQNKPLLPVMVWIHGGGWMCGESNMAYYGPEYILDKNVVLVTINYRLGPLGFLSTLDEYCPGNNGLKDQQEALRFVQKTIRSFGGDENSVTLFGESAGGASVHYHMLSDTSKGLFHKAISQSGTAMVPWAEAPPGEALRNVFRLAKYVGCPQAPSERMVSCLRTKDSYDIINTEHVFYSWDYEPMTPFKAVVEPDLPGAFLTKSVREIPKSPAVPWMTGITRDEGCIKSGWITTNLTRYQQFTTSFAAIAPVSFYYEYSPYVDVITEKLRKFYLQTQTLRESKSAILNMFTDSYFAYPLIEGVEFTFNYTKNPVYLYELSHKPAASFAELYGFIFPEDYVCHTDDLQFLFPIRFLSKPLDEENTEISKLMVTMFTNFAISGNPNTPQEIPFNWEPATSGKRMEYLEIGPNVMKEDLASRSRFWGTLPIIWPNIRSGRFYDTILESSKRVQVSDISSLTDAIKMALNGTQINIPDSYDLVAVVVGEIE